MSAVVERVYFKCRAVLGLLSCLSISFLIPNSSWAWPQSYSGVAGWENSELSTEVGLETSGSTISYSSPVIADLDGEPENGKEIVVASDDGQVFAYSASAELLWSITLPSATCGGSSRGNKTLSSPAVGDLDGDGIPSIVIGYGGVAVSGCDGGIASYRADTGIQEWNFSLKEFAKKERFWTKSNTVFSTPALADTDGDGKLEIGFGSFDRNVYLLEFDGTVRWYYNAADTVWSSGAFADVNNDGKLEFLIGTDISGNTRLKPITKDGGYVYAFKTDKRQGKSKKINFRDKSAYLWQRWFDQVVFSSPVVADVVSSNPGNEVIIISGCYFPQSSNDKRGKAISVLSLSSGAILRRLPIEACSPSSVAVADVNRDGNLDIVASVNGHKNVGGSGKSSLVAYSPEDSSLLWSTTPMERGGNDAWGGHFNSPVIADIDKNGSLEVLLANRASVSIFSGNTGEYLSCPSSECTDGRRIAYTASTLRGTPAVDDIDNDGRYDVVIGGGNSDRRGTGFIYAWTDFEDTLISESIDGPQGELPWPMARGAAERSGLYEN